MNATNLYLSTCRLITIANAADKSSWTDLFRLVPYLRQSLSCTVCGNLLKEPYTPTITACQHHVCKKCIGGKKKLKPSCSWCKNYEKYAENLHLRIILQCYKAVCKYFTLTEVYKILVEEDKQSTSVNNGNVARSSLIDLIQEAAEFSDDYKSPDSYFNSAISMLPCVYTNSTSTQTQGASTSNNTEVPTSSKNSPTTRSLSNGSPVYSVMYAGTGNKITIKRQAVEEVEALPQRETRQSKELCKQGVFKKPSTRSRSFCSKRKGCRCGNATATPGKLTCCGQRCPCYVESKPCTECKCKGCRNPHRADGLKVRPHIPELDNIVTIEANSDSSMSYCDSMDSLTSETLTMEDTVHFDSSNLQVYSSELQEVSASLPATILMDEEFEESSEEDESSSPQDFKDNSPQDDEVSPSQEEWSQSPISMIIKEEVDDVEEIEEELEEEEDEEEEEEDDID